MVDIAKIKAGDRVTVEGVVIGVKNDVVCFDAGVGGDAARHYAHMSGIASHTPAPREFKPGDEVRNVEQFKNARLFIIATFDETAWIRDANNWSMLCPINELRHADPSPAPQEPEKGRKKIEAWVNAYPESEWSRAHKSRSEADQVASKHRIACLHVVGYEGDGL
jgi:hypothetical protein